MKINIKNISVIIGVILVLGIGTWYATSEISEAKAAKVKSARIVKSLRDKLVEADKERNGYIEKLDQLNRELSATEEIKERNNILYVMQCVSSEKLEKINQNLREQLMSINAELKENLISLISNNRETLEGCSKKIDDIRYMAIDEKWSTDKAVRMMASAYHDGDATLRENGVNMLALMGKASEKSNDAMEEATKALERLTSIVDEQKEEALKDPAAYWKKMPGSKESKVESEDK